MITIRNFLIAVGVVGCACGSFALPRPPQPPVPSFGLLFNDGFNQPYEWPANSAIDSAIWTESWSGWALYRQGVVVQPWIVPMVVSNAFRVDAGRGAIRFWYRPDWNSESGPGNVATLATLVSATDNNEATWWSLVVTPDGKEIHLLCQTSSGVESCMKAEVNWSAGGWHLVTMGYTPTNSVLFLDDQQASTGDGLPTVPKEAFPFTSLVVGSTLSGADSASGQIEELSTFTGRSRFMQMAGHEFGLIENWDIGIYYAGQSTLAALGPISAAEQAAMAQRRSERKAKNEAGGEGGGGMMRMLSGGTAECITNVPVYITNIVTSVNSTQGYVVTFDIQGDYGGSTAGPFDIFTTTNLVGNNITNSVWTWLERGPSCNTYQYTNQPGVKSFYILGTPKDSDQGGVPDAYELLINHGDTNNAGDDYFVPPDLSVGILDSALTCAYGSLPTNWNYFVLPESVKEALRSDGTTFAVVGDRQIAGGLLLPNGKPRFPILISLGAEAVGDDEIAALTNYVAAGGFLLVGSSSFTRNATGGLRSDFAIANQMSLTCTPSPANWVNNEQIFKRAAHRLVNDFPDDVLIWRMPSSAEETSWGTCADGHTYSAPHKIWQVNTNGDNQAQLLITGDVSPYLAVKQYGNGYFIYHADMQPLIAHGGNGPGMYAYMIFRRAIEWAFESAQRPVVKLSPWPYQYDAAFMVRHDLENFVEAVADVTTSAAYEYNHGAKGDYYFCTGAITNAGVDTAGILAGLKYAAGNLGATIGPHNGGLSNPIVSCALTPGQYEYFHWGLDEAFGVTNGVAYASNSLAISFNQIELWITNQAASPRTWVVPYFSGTREDSYKMQEGLGVKIHGEQKLSPFPHWTLSTKIDGKRYAILSEPVSDWFVGQQVAQVVGPWQGASLGNGQHDSSTLHQAVDFYYNNGFLINFYSHSLTSTTNIVDGGSAAPLMADYVVYCTNHARMWSANARDGYQWWLQRSNVQITASYGTNGTHTIAGVAINGSQNTNTSIELLAQGAGAVIVYQLKTNGVTASTNSYRISGELVKVRVGTAVTNVQVEYSPLPLARNDTYSVVQGQVLTVSSNSGVLVNDFAGSWPGLHATNASGNSHGNLSFNSNGGFTYTPTNNFWGTECFTYQAHDSQNSFGTATVTIFVGKTNTLYSDDFVRCSGNSISPWVAAFGTWSLNSDLMQGSNVLNNYSFAYHPSTWTNHSVEVWIQFPSGAFGGGVGGRLTPASGTHYAAWIYPEGSAGGSNVLKLVKFTDWSNFSVLAQTNLASVGTTNHTLKVTFNTNQITVYLDNLTTPKISFTDTSSPYLTGAVSLDMWTDASAYIMSASNFIVAP